MSFAFCVEQASPGDIHCTSLALVIGEDAHGAMVLSGSLGSSPAMRVGGRDYPAPYTQPWWWISAGVSVFLVLFAGIMSGLTLGLMSLGLMDLEVLQQSGTEEEKEQASTFPSTITVRIFSFLALWFRVPFLGFSFSSFSFLLYFLFQFWIKGLLYSSCVSSSVVFNLQAHTLFSHFPHRLNLEAQFLERFCKPLV